MISQPPATMMSSRSKAQEIADRLNDKTDNEDDFDYGVVARGAWFVIAVYEDGELIGEL
jgi:hypothetical protein